MKKQILLFVALSIMTHVNSQVTWTVTNNSAVTTGGAVGTDNSGNLQFCVENAVNGDIITFDASLSGATINFGDMGTTPLNPTAVSIDASALASPVIFDGQNTNRIIKSVNSYSNAGDTLRFKNIIFQNGKATTSAGVGALECREHLIVENCKFINNSYTLIDGYGVGALKMSARNAYVRLSDCVFENNSSAYRGGAIWLSSNKSLIERCYFTGNQTGSTDKSAGAVLYAATGDGPNESDTFIEFRNCTMVNNYSARANHGIVIHNANTNLVNNTGSKLRLINCTIYGNGLNGEATGTTITTIYSEAHAIEVGGCLMGNNLASDIRTKEGVMIESLGFNTYHEFHQRALDNSGSNFESTSKHPSDIVYNNDSWLAAPLASPVNAEGVMIPIKTDETLFATNIQRIPSDTLITWHGVNPVDQLGSSRNTVLGTVGAYHSSILSAVNNLLLNNTVKFDGNILSLTGAKNSLLKIHTVSGVLISQELVNSDDYRKDIQSYNKGVYILSLRDENQKLNAIKFIK